MISLLAAGARPSKSLASPSPAAAQGAAGVTLTGDTSRPDISTFAPGEDVELTFDVEGLKAAGPAVTLQLSMVDEHERKIAAREIPVQADSAGHWQTRLSAPHARLGFYRVYARLSDGVLLQASGSRRAGFLTYAVMPDPAKRLDYGEAGSRFGMQGGFGPWADKVLAFLGARWVLDGGLEWSKQEPDHAGQFGPQQIQQYVADPYPKSSAWHQYGLPTLMRAPKWAVVPETLTYMTGTLTPEGEKAWYAYCQAAARAYTVKYPDRKQHIYQITWEPIQPWGFKGTNADLVHIYEIAYKALHAADPRAVVSGPTRGIYNNGDPQDTLRLLQLGLGRYLDGYTAHPYDTMTPEQDGMAQAIRTVKAALRAATHKNLPLMGTEQGWSTDEDPAKDLEQAQGLIRQNLIMLGEGFRFNFAFYIADYRLSGQKGYGYYYTLDKDVPFGPQKISPRPIAAAYAAQSMLLDGCRSASAIDWLGDKVCGYVFEWPGRRVLAVWDYGVPREVSIPTGVRQVEVFDWMGNARRVATVAGSLKLALGPEPVYIRGVSPKLWGSTAPKVLRLDPKRLRAYPRGRVSLTGSALLPAGKPVPATLTLAADQSCGIPPLSRRIVLGASRRVPFRFDLQVPAALRSGSYPLRLLLRDAAGNTLSATGMTLEVAAPVAVRIEPAFRADGVPEVAVTLQNHEAQEISGRLDLRLKELLPGAARSDLPMIDLVADPGKTRDVPGTSRQIAFQAPPGASRRLILALPGTALSPTHRYQALLTLTSTSGYQSQQTAPIDFLPARSLRHPLAINGNLADWESIPPVTLTGPQDVIRSPQYYSPVSGLSARLRFAWDERALYIAAEVKDDVFFQNFTGGDIWRDDCLQLAFNLDPEIADNAPNAPDRRASEMTVALTKNGPEAFRHLSFAPDRLALGALSPRQIHLVIRRIGPGNLIYEMAIPWPSLGLFGGAPGKTVRAIGIAATVNEVRSADQSDPCALGLFGGITPTKDPDKFGTLVLEEKE